MGRLHGIRERGPRPAWDGDGRPVQAGRRYDWNLIVVTLIMLGIAIGIPASIFASIRSSRIESVCRDHGYPDERINWGGLGAAYCVKRVDQTDVVVPVGDL